jgi:hypothetical protein
MKSSGSGLESRNYGRRESAGLTTWHLLSAKFALTSPTSGGRSVCIVHSLAQATKFSCSHVKLFAVVSEDTIAQARDF